MTRLQELEDRGEDAGHDAYVRCIVEFLEARQSPDTGFWGSSPSLEDGMNGLLKTYAVYETLGRPLPRPAPIARSILKVQRPDGSFGDGCSPWNALTLMTALAKQTPELRAGFQKSAVRLAPNLARRRQPDGMYCSLDNGCLRVYAGVRLCDKPERVSDLLGTAQTLGALLMIEAFVAG